jgi:RNA polymerase sigma factor (sigma-70 family)
MIPEALASLLHATDDGSRDRAWAAFLEQYSALIIRAARGMGGDVDSGMDRYAYVIDQLQHGDFRRLRGYVADGRGLFTTWLVLVVRRLCLDEHRHRYGRSQSVGSESRDRQAMRRRLLDLVGSELDIGEIDLPSEVNPDATLRGRELREVLAQAVASLETRDRLLLRLRFEDERAVPDIARILRFPSVASAYRRLESVLGVLRRKLVTAGVRDSQP